MKQHIETSIIRTQLESTQYQEHSAPLFLTSSFTFEDAEEMRASFAEEKQRNIYSRFSNPNTGEFIEKICLLEGAQDGFAFSTGMAAVFSTLAALLDSNDHILASQSLFGSTHSLFTKFLPKWNIDHSYFSTNASTKEIEKLITKQTKILFVESPTNPGVEILDLEVLGNIAKKHNLIFIVDNCFATPYLQQPITYGADLIIHSATKLIDGQGRVLGGVTVGKSSLIREIFLFSRNTGPAMSPFNAWILSKSLETLPVRLDKHCDNALKVAKFLEQHRDVEQVNYPFLPSHPQFDLAKKQMKLGGSVVSFVIKGGLQAGRNFIDSLLMCSRTSNLGDTRSIVTHPASTTHGKLSKEDQLATGISPGLIRVSVGLEHVEDIIADLNQALKKHT